MLKTLVWISTRSMTTKIIQTPWFYDKLDEYRICRIQNSKYFTFLTDS